MEGLYLVYEIAEEIFADLVGWIILLIEIAGVFVLAAAAVRSLILYGKKDPGVGLFLARGIAIGLEVLLVAEVLKTVLIRDIRDVILIAGIVALRVTLTILVHWEIRLEEEETEKEEDEKETAQEDEKETAQEEAG